jgi:Cu/Ag efflux protein CusF
MDKIGGNLLKVVQEYATVYPDVADDRAQRLLSTLMDLEKERSATRASFLKKSEKILPASKTLRLAQVESRLDLALQLTLASRVPLVPIEGTLMPDSGAAVAVAPGSAGGVAVKVVELKATVIAIDAVARKVTLMSADGIKETVKAGPDVINFDQIHVGDELRVKATQELVVQVSDASEPAGTGVGAVVGLAPEGAKPGGVAAQVVRVTGTVKAIDPEKHTATLQFADGSSRTFPVRDDVQLGKYKVGDQVVFQATEAIALTVDKP